KFTEQGEAVLPAQTESQNGGKIQAHFSVTDTGIGIPPENLSPIFEAFFQADSSTTRPYGGARVGPANSGQLGGPQCGKVSVGRCRWKGKRGRVALSTSLRDLRANRPARSGLSQLGALLRTCLSSS